MMYLNGIADGVIYGGGLSALLATSVWLAYAWARPTAAQAIGTVMGLVLISFLIHVLVGLILGWVARRPPDPQRVDFEESP
jgi:ABC-type Fe3+ transport system permease subunit